MQGMVFAFVRCYLHARLGQAQPYAVFAKPRQSGVDFMVQTTLSRVSAGFLARRGFLAGLCAATLAAWMPSAANAEGNAAQFLDSYATKAVDMLGDPATPKATRVNNFEVLLAEGFDINTISRFILGRYWRGATAEEREEFIKVFSRVLAERYAPIFEGADRSRFSVGDAQPIKGKDNLYMVDAKVISDDGTPIMLRWRIAQRSAGYQILDVMVEGVSMVITLRDEYGSVIRQEGVTGLIDRLRKTLKTA
jgi:phospholipid transport system substrate-binding protein